MGLLFDLCFFDWFGLIVFVVYSLFVLLDKADWFAWFRIAVGVGCWLLVWVFCFIMLFTGGLYRGRVFGVCLRLGCFSWLVCL